MSLSVPNGWDSIEARRSTPHGEFEVTVYADGSAYANWWRNGNAVPLGKSSTPGQAIARCNLELAILNAAEPASCGPENVDADGREVPP